MAVLTRLARHDCPDAQPREQRLHVPGHPLAGRVEERLAAPAARPRSLHRAVAGDVGTDELADHGSWSRHDLVRDADIGGAHVHDAIGAQEVRWSRAAAIEGISRHAHNTALRIVVEVPALPLRYGTSPFDHSRIDVADAESLVVALVALGQPEREQEGVVA